MKTLLNDVRYGVRSLLKYPGFTAIAVLTLALGIGANTAIFSLLSAVLLRPLPFTEPERLVQVHTDGSAIGLARGEVASGTYVEWKNGQTAFSDMAVVGLRTFSLGDGEPERVVAQAVSHNFLSVLGVQPLVGRSFLPEEDKPGGSKVAIITYGLWQRRYAGDAGVVNRDILLDGEKFRVIGVMPERFQYLSNTVGLWIPVAFTPAQLVDHDNQSYKVVARLKSDVSIPQADADIQAITQRIVRDYPEDAVGLKSIVEPLREEMVANVRRPLLMLVVAAGLVLLIACANLASLQLSRATSRAQEIAVRAALGASRARIVQQLLVESVLLSCLGGLIGLLMALWSFALLKQLVPPGLVLLTSLKIDISVFGFALGISLLTGILFGLAPALQASRVELNDALKQGGIRTGSGAKGSRLRGTLVIAEVAVAVVLLIAAGLMVQTIRNMFNQYSLFQPETLLTLRTILPDSKFRDVTQYQTKEHVKRVAFYDQVLERVSALPGVVSAGYTTAVPLNWKGGANGVEIESRQHEEGRTPNAIHRQISNGYLQTLGVPLVAGRFFGPQDGPQTMPVAIVNESLAREWRGENPIGKRFRLGTRNAPWITVVGVVADIRQMGMDVPVKSEMYVPYQQIASHPWYSPRDLIVRANADPAELVPAIRRQIHQVDPEQAVSSVATMEEVLAKEAGTRRLGMILLSAFAGLAMLLAALGIYGVLSFFVAQHTREIGVRLALGAQLHDVLRLVFKKGMAWTLLGVAIGLVAALGLSRLMASLLFGVSPTDPLTFAAIAAILTAVALLACYVPARRATKVDPLVALRWE